LGIKQIAYDAYCRIQTLEEILVAKGILQKGEAAKYHQDMLAERAKQYKKLREDFWNRINDGDHIEYTQPFSRNVWEGVVLAKSVRPWEVLTVMIVKKLSSRIKEGSRFVLEPCEPEFIVVTHKNGEREHLSSSY
jgi:hypothetical protein